MMDLRRQTSAHRRILVIFALIVLGAVAPRVVKPIAGRMQIPYTPDPKRDQTSGVLTVLRGLQMSLADICFNKSTEYQHDGVRYRQLEEDIAGNLLRDQAESDATDDVESTPSATVPPDVETTPSIAVPKPDRQESSHEGHDHEGHDHEEHAHKAVPFILMPEEDFRGVIGEVERQVKPYSAEHVHHKKTNERESLPWLRLATWINPEHEMSWIAMAFWLQGTKNERGASEAIELLERARALNRPREDEPYAKHALLYMLGHLYFVDARQPQKAVEVLDEAFRLGARDFVHLDPVQQDWLNFCVRDLVQASRKLGRYQQALDYCTSGLALYPEDWTLHRTRTRLEKNPKKQGQQKSPTQ